MHPLLRALAGGDLRSTGLADDVVRRVLAKPGLAAALVAGMNEADPVIRMRCADALEKATCKKPRIAQDHADALFALLSRPQPKEILWHLLQMAPRVTWSPGQLRVIEEVVDSAHSHSSSIVKACALQAEVELLAQDPARRLQVRHRVAQALASPIAAVSARARKMAKGMKIPGAAGNGGAADAVAPDTRAAARRSPSRRP